MLLSEDFMTQTTANLMSKLVYSKELKLRGFDYPVQPYGGLAFRSFSPSSSQSQFDGFVQRVCQSVGRSYLPIYRIADGEFAFLVGWHASLSRGRGSNASLSLLRQLLSFLRRRVDRRASSTIWGEAYETYEQGHARQRMQQGIQHVANHGILALYFAERADGWSEQYFIPMCKWFDSNEITLDEWNYVPFYFVYALLNGPARRCLYRDKHLLVVTHLTDSRKQIIEESLLQEGVRTVQFLAVSPNRSMFDHVDVSTIEPPVDLALVAAGIGSVNVIQQLEPLSVPCIDCGISIECLVDFNRRLERPFLLDDERIISTQVGTQSLRFLK